MLTTGTGCNVKEHQADSVVVEYDDFVEVCNDSLSFLVTNPSQKKKKTNSKNYYRGIQISRAHCFERIMNFYANHIMIFGFLLILKTLNEFHNFICSC